MKNVSNGERNLAIAGAVLLLLTFMSWYGVDVPGSELAAAAGLDTSVSAWQAFDFIDLVLFVAAVAAIAPAALHAAGQTAPGWLTPLAMGAGALATVLVLYRLINEPGPDEIIEIKFGAYLGLLAAAAVTFLAMGARGHTATPTTTPSV